MNSKKIIATSVIGIMLLTATAFAATTAVPSANANMKHQGVFQKGDPIQRLEDLKSKITEKFKAGKISQDEENKMLTKINDAEQKIKDFNNMTLDQKKQTLIKDFTARINQRVKDGKLTQDKANSMIQNFTDKVNKWDGKGYPKELRGLFGMKMHKNADGRFKKALDQAVKDNKITAQQEQDILNYLKTDKNNFNKANTTSNFKTSNSL
ncbi:hypothetical protein ACETAC_08885 [Aceticella autotrophica]|uniref:Uncharacterized protein n=1 Tax=Aceticella autotrophica TaxID=2755338 RepID=A0A975AV19_9THEO|nr:hypothetical protein [Aceticella autotrophica]QSZ26974.1 hypothetical protein ACETAC_08885 [Aceticella autotrophica]